MKIINFAARLHPFLAELGTRLRRAEKSALGRIYKHRDKFRKYVLILVLDVHNGDSLFKIANL